MSIIEEINCISADMWSINASNWSFFPNIVYLDCIVPTSGCNSVLTQWIKFYAKNPIGMTWHFSVFLHSKDNGFGLFVIKSNIFIFSSRGQESTFTVVVYCVELVIWVILTNSLMKALSRSSVPMLKVAISICCHEDIGSLHGGSLGSPSEGSDWHVVRHTILVKRTA